VAKSHEHASSETGGGFLEIPRVATRKRGARPGEGALGDGRRPGPAKPPSLTRRRWKAGLPNRSDGDAASRPDPRKFVTEDVRSDVVSPARGRKHRDREVQRGGAVDRGPARTALCRSRGRSGQSPRNALSGAPFGGSRDDGGSSRSRRFAVKRSSTWSTHPARQSGRHPNLVAARLRPRVSQRSPRASQDARGATRHRKVERDDERNQELNSPQGAREGSRLQKSVRRIFLVARSAPVERRHARARGSSRRPVGL
jgi:hypothetical protein